LKLHDVVEVLGVMSVVPALAALHHQQQQQHGAEGGHVHGYDAMNDPMNDPMNDVDDFWQERVAALPPTSQVCF
jgi:hypothetical protein